MANLNRIVLVGRLTADPESRSTAEGQTMTKFKLAVESTQGLSQAEPFKGQTELIDVVTWRMLADNCVKRLKKNDLVLVEGRIQIRTFDDQVGQKRWVTEVVGREVAPLEGSRKAGTQRPAQSENVVDDSDLVSDLPF